MISICKEPHLYWRPGSIGRYEVFNDRFPWWKGPRQTVYRIHRSVGGGCGILKTGFSPLEGLGATDCVQHAEQPTQGMREEGRVGFEQVHDGI